MDFALQRQQQQDAARMMMFQNSGYQFERRDKKTLILDITDQGTSTTNPLTNGTQFSVDLFEPLIIDKLSDIYLDTVITHNCLVTGDNNTAGFCLKINEFNINSNCASTSSNQQLYNSIFIPNEHNDVGNHFSGVIHKGKKMNYVCSINPGKINSLSGKITSLDGTSAFTNTTEQNINTSTLYHVKITAGVGTVVPAKTIFSFSDGWGIGKVFSVANNMRKGATDLNFNHVGSGNITFVPSDDLGNIIANGSAFEGKATTLSDFNTNTTTDKSSSVGDQARFIAEFIIVARE